MNMNLKLSLPTKVLFDQPVAKINAQAVHGNFCVLPRHADYLAALVPGILTFTCNDQELFFANDHGLLVKRESEVYISVRRAVQGSNLGSLRQTVRDQFERLSESDRACQGAVARLEASFLRKFLNLNQEAP